jgi:hypothetical protein
VSEITASCSGTSTAFESQDTHLHPVPTGVPTIVNSLAPKGDAPASALAHRDQPSHRELHGPGSHSFTLCMSSQRVHSAIRLHLVSPRASHSSHSAGIPIASVSSSCSSHHLAVYKPRSGIFHRQCQCVCSPTRVNQLRCVLPIHCWRCLQM